MAVGYATFIYDGPNDQYIYTPGALIYTWPDETCIELANRTNTDLWMCRPVVSDDDFATQRTTLVRNTLNSGLKFYDEFSNENWNQLSAILPFYYLLVKAFYGMALNADGGRSVKGLEGLRIRQSMAAVTAAWSPRTMTELVRVCGVQAQGSTSEYDTYLFKGTDLGAYGYNVAPNRPIDYIDMIATAPYVSGANIREFVASYALPLDDAMTAWDDYASGTPSRMESALDWIHNDFMDGDKDGVAGTQTIAAHTASSMTNWNTIATTYSKNVGNYEGGPGMTPISEAKCTSLSISTGYSAKSANLITAYRQNMRSKILMAAYLKASAAKSRTTLPGIYTGLGTDTWSVRTSLQATPYALEDGFRLFNNGITPFLLRTS